MPFEEKIEHLLNASPYALPPDEKEAILLPILKDEVGYACRKHDGYGNYVRHWPQDYRASAQIAGLPFLPVGTLKTNPPLCLVDPADVKHVLTSSATTSQVPSRVAIDAPTARRMTKSVVSIVRDFIGSARRPYLVVDTRDFLGSASEMGARGAAIQGLRPFASETTFCLDLNAQAELVLLREKLDQFAKAHHDAEILIYGFTSILWTQFAKPLSTECICLGLKNARVLHSGGWKRLKDQAVDKATFNELLARIIGCTPDRIVDFYGMVESVGLIFPDCAAGNKHAPAFGEVIVRDPFSLEPVAAGQLGILQVCSVLPTSFPGHLLLTEDMAEVVTYDGCPCGRRGIAFRFAGRIPQAELRGCGDVESKRPAVN